MFAEVDRAGRLDDTDYLQDTLVRSSGLTPPTIELSRRSLRAILGAINAGRRLVGKRRIEVGDAQGEIIMRWLAAGYRANAGKAHGGPSAASDARSTPTRSAPPSPR